MKKIIAGSSGKTLNHLLTKGIYEFVFTIRSSYIISSARAIARSKPPASLPPAVAKKACPPPPP